MAALNCPFPAASALAAPQYGDATSEIAQREREAAGQRKARIEAMSEGNAPDGKA